MSRNPYTGKRTDLGPLFAQPDADFAGKTYDHDRDRKRLEGLLGRVRAILADGQWHTLPELSKAACGSEASVSARIRDLRKPEFGGFTVDKEFIGNGLWRYRLVLP